MKVYGIETRVNSTEREWMSLYNEDIALIFKKLKHRKSPGVVLLPLQTFGLCIGAERKQVDGNYLIFLLPAFHENCHSRYGFFTCQAKREKKEKKKGEKRTDT